MRQTNRHNPRQQDSLFLAIVLSAVLLAVVVSVLSVVFPPDQVVAAFPLFVPAVYFVAAFAGIGIASMALARFWVLPDSQPFFFAVGFVAFGILAVFFLIPAGFLLVKAEQYLPVLVSSAVNS